MPIKGKQIKDSSILLVKLNPQTNQIFTLLGNSKIQQNQTPITGIDLANKDYVDSVAQGINGKISCRVTTTTNISIVSAPSSIDSVTLSLNDRILVKDQILGQENGLYQFNGTGNPLTRTIDADSNPEVKAGLYTFVTEGTTYQDTGWLLSTNDPIIVGTTPLVFIQFSSAGLITVSNGLTKTGINIKLGGQIIENTLLSGSYSMTYDVDQLRYLNNQHSTYTNRSLVDKEYVDIEFNGLDTRLTDVETIVYYNNQLISGGASFVSGLTFAITDLLYIISGQLYNSLASNVTINVGDPSFDRIDIIVVDIFGVVSVVEGLPAINPIKPDIDESTQVEVTFITVPMGAVALPIPITIVYDENIGPPTEWSATTNFPSNINVNSSTGTPYSGTKSIELTNVPTAKTIVFSTATPFDTTTQNTLQFAIKNKIAWTTTRRLRITLQSSVGVQLGSIVDIYQGMYGFSSANTSVWQVITIPISKFFAPSALISKIVITTYSTSGTLNLYLDFFRLIVGSPTTTTQNTFLSIQDDASGITTATSPTDILSILGGSNLTSVVGTKTLTLNLDSYIGLTGITTSQIAVTSASASTLAYFNSTKQLTSVVLGGGLTFSGGTLSTVSNLSGTTNYVAKFINSSTVGDGIIYDDGTNIGIGTTLSTAKLDVRGQIVSGLGTGAITSNDSPFYASRLSSGSPNYFTGWQYVFEVGGGIWGIGMNYVNNQYQFLTNGGSTAKFIFGDGNPSTPNGKFAMDLNGGYFGSNITNPLATIHGVGLDSTSTNYAFKLDNSSSTSLFSIRNDGNAYMGNNTAVSVVTPISLDLGGQYSSNNGINPKLVIYNNAGSRSGFGMSYTGSGQTEFFTLAVNTAIDFTWYQGTNALARLSSDTLTFHRNDNALGYGFAISFDLNNSSNIRKTYGLVSGAIIDNTDGSEDGRLTFYTVGNGSLTEKMRIDELGNVSIGTTTALSKLYVNSSIQNEQIVLNNDDITGSSYFALAQSGGTKAGMILLNSNHPFIPKTLIVRNLWDNGGIRINGGSADTNMMYFDTSTFNVGIGTVLPTSLLHIVGTNSSTGYSLKIDNSSATQLLYVRNDGSTIFNNSAFINNNPTPFQSFLAGDYLGTLNNNLNIAAGISVPGSNTFRISYYGNTQWLSALSIQNAGASFGNLILMQSGGYVSIGGTTLGAAKLEITGGTDQGIYAVSSNNIAVNGVGNGGAGFGLKGETNFGTALRANVTDNSGVALDLVNTTIPISPIDLFKVLGDGRIFAPPTYNDLVSVGTASFLGIDSTGKLFNTNASPASLGNVFATGSVNYTPRWISSNTLSGTSSIYDNGTNVGIGMTSSTATLHIKGIDNTSSNYALQVDSSLVNSFWIRNDRVVNISDALIKNRSINLLGVETFYPGEIYGESIFVNVAVLSEVRFWSSSFSKIHQGVNPYSISITTGGGEPLEITQGLVKITSIPTTFTGTASVLGIDSNGILFNTGLVSGSVGNIQGTGSTNYIPRWISSTTLSGTSSIYDDGTHVSLGVTGSTNSRLTIFTEDNLVTSYGIRMVQAVSGNDLFYVKSNGYSEFSTLSRLSVGTSPDPATRLSIQGIGGPSTNNILIAYPQGGALIGLIVKENTNVGVGKQDQTPTARLHVEGLTSDSSAYALKVDNNTTNPLLYVRNDGGIYALPTYATQSNSGTFNLLGIDSTGKLFNTGLTSSSGGPSSGSGVTGSGIINYIPRWSSTDTLTSTSSIYDNGDVYIGLTGSASNAKFISHASVNQHNMVASVNGTDDAYVGIGVYTTASNTWNFRVTKGGAIQQTNNYDSYLANGTGSLSVGSNGNTSSKFNVIGSGQHGIVSIVDGTDDIYAGLGILKNNIDWLFRVNKDGNVGAGLNLTPTAKVHIKGDTSGSGSYSFKVDNSSSNNLLSLANDGLSILGFTGGNARTQVNIGDSQYFRINANDNAGFALSDSGSDWFRILPTAFNEAVLSSNGVLDIKAGGASTLYARFSEGAGGIGINIQNPTARVHIVGVDATSSNYALKVDSSTTNIISVRNDGAIITLPTYGTSSFTGTSGVVGIDSTGKLYNTGFNPSASTTGTIGIGLDGGGAVISTGFKQNLIVPYNCVITGWSVLASVTGSCVIDVWKSTGSLPNASNSIAGTEKPTLSSQIMNTDNALTTWTASCTSGDIIGFNVDSISLIDNLTLILKINKI